MKYEAIVVGVSSGGLNALKIIFSLLPKDFSLPIIIAQHVSPRSDSQWLKTLNDMYGLQAKEADEKEKIENGKIYFAPPNYHLLIEKNKTFSLSIDEPVNFARPSIDVLFDSASEAYTNKLIGIILTGANSDGAKGLKKIKENKGLTIVQDPSESEVSGMPIAAISLSSPKHILSLKEIPHLLIQIDKDNYTSSL